MKQKTGGPPSKFRGKDRSRKVSGVMTQKGWTLLERQLKKEGLSQGDWIETLIRRHAGERV